MWKQKRKHGVVPCGKERIKIVHSVIRSFYLSLVKMTCFSTFLLSEFFREKIRANPPGVYTTVFFVVYKKYWSESAEGSIRLTPHYRYTRDQTSFGVSASQFKFGVRSSGVPSSEFRVPEFRSSEFRSSGGKKNLGVWNANLNWKIKKSVSESSSSFKKKFWRSLLCRRSLLPVRYRIPKSGYRISGIPMSSFPLLWRH